jgi:hypothetical protein
MGVDRDLVDDLLERVQSAAFASDGHRRGWDAVRTAALLRDRGLTERALNLLDEVVERFDYHDVVAGAYACAVAIHCDTGNPERGIKAGRTIWDATQSVELGNALARAYWDRFEQTDDPDHRAEWVEFKEVFDQEASSAA